MFVDVDDYTLLFHINGNSPYIYMSRISDQLRLPATAKIISGAILLWAVGAKSEPALTVAPVAHMDRIEVDNALSLAMEKYPDTAWLKSLEEEAEAIKKRGESWTAGASQAGLRYQNMTSGTVDTLFCGWLGVIFHA